MFEMAKAVCSLQWGFVDLNRYMQKTRWWTFTSITACVCSHTYFNVNFVGVHTRRCTTRPVHIDWHDILSVSREGCNSLGVLKWSSKFYQIAVRISYINGATIANGARSLPVVDAEVIDVSGGVVAIHNIPGEGDVGAVLVSHLEIANNIPGICECLKLLECNIKF